MTEPAPAPGRRVHREHYAVSQVVRGRYASAVPEIGLEGAEHWFGLACQTGPGRARVVLSIAGPAGVPAALAAARAACAAGSLMIMVDDRERAGRLDVALRAHERRSDESTTYLALAGPMHFQMPRPARPQVAPVGSAELAAGARVRLQAFAGSADPPAAGAVAAGAAQRRRELPHQTGRLASPRAWVALPGGPG
jgi:hypothetical protein